SSPMRFACLLLAILTTGALAQERIYELDEDGNWVLVEEPTEGSDAAVIRDARQLIVDGNPGQARDLLDRWIDAQRTTKSPWYPLALLVRGDAKQASGNEYKALYDYERITKEFAGSDVFPTAVEREVDIAVQYVNGLRKRAFGIRWENAERIGEELLIRAHERMPGSSIGERAIIELADYYYRVRDMRSASTTYELFLENYPDSSHRRKAMQRRVYANIARFKGPRYDGSGLLEARILVEEFASRYPADAEQAGLTDALVARIDESAAQEMLETARWYLRRGDKPAARYTLKRLLTKLDGRYARTVAASEAHRIMDREGWTVEREP
ncbi:MAG: outer membrane protein assembly factor BamD, partial [Phycisphaerales bacterium]|nr:outer membrane protein assembly factor BamD [Phycisphaerales bacterium]